MGCLDVAFRRVGVETHELQCGAGVLGQELDQAVGEGGRDELAGTQIERAADAQAVRFERLAVHLGEQPALGEVERSHGDGPVVRRGRPDGCAPSGAAHAQPRRHRDHRDDDHDHATAAHTGASPEIERPKGLSHTRCTEGKERATPPDGATNEDATAAA